MSKIILEDAIGRKIRIQLIDMPMVIKGEILHVYKEFILVQLPNHNWYINLKHIIWFEVLN